MRSAGASAVRREPHNQAGQQPRGRAAGSACVARAARSGAYNRTLTPFGFQAEERTLWQAPQTYITMSPFMQVGGRGPACGARRRLADVACATGRGMWWQPRHVQCLLDVHAAMPLRSLPAPRCAPRPNAIVACRCCSGTAHGCACA